MVSPNVDRILQQTRSLTLEEREQFMDLLRAQPAIDSQSSQEQQIAMVLLQKGIIRKIPRKPTSDDIARFHAWKPIQLEGRPVSEMLIEERR